MSPRRHAHSKSAPPRLFTAATGLSSGTAAKPTGTAGRTGAKATRSLRPRRPAKDKAPRVAETRPARSFSLAPTMTQSETTGSEAPVGRPTGAEVGAPKPIGTSEAQPTKPTGAPVGTGKPTGTPRAEVDPRQAVGYAGGQADRGDADHRKPTTAKPTTAKPTRSGPGASTGPPHSRPALWPRLRPRRPEGARTGPERAKTKPGAKSGVGPAPSKRRRAPTSTRRPPSPAPTAAAPSDRSPATRKRFDPRLNRRRAPLALAALFAVGVLVIGFPLSGLLSQHHQLSAAAAQLNQLQSQNRN